MTATQSSKARVKLARPPRSPQKRPSTYFCNLDTKVVKITIHIYRPKRRAILEIACGVAKINFRTFPRSWGFQLMHRNSRRPTRKILLYLNATHGRRSNAAFTKTRIRGSSSSSRPASKPR